MLDNPNSSLNNELIVEQQTNNTVRTQPRSRHATAD